MAAVRSSSCLASSLRARVIGVLGFVRLRLRAVHACWRATRSQRHLAAADRRAGHEPAAAGPRPRLPSADSLRGVCRLRDPLRLRHRGPARGKVSTRPGGAGCGPGRWSAWCFLTCGIALGSWWSYYVLGWGGYWFWDPGGERFAAALADRHGAAAFGVGGGEARGAEDLDGAAGDRRPSALSTVGHLPGAIRHPQFGAFSFAN